MFGSYILCRSTACPHGDDVQSADCYPRSQTIYSRCPRTSPSHRTTYRKKKKKERKSIKDGNRSKCVAHLPLIQSRSDDIAAALTSSIPRNPAHLYYTTLAYFLSVYLHFVARVVHSVNFILSLNLLHFQIGDVKMEEVREVTKVDRIGKIPEQSRIGNQLAVLFVFFFSFRTTLCNLTCTDPHAPATAQHALPCRQP